MKKPLKKCKAQHGDVTMMQGSEIPKDYKKVEIADGFVVERGEGTHTHVLKNTKGCDCYQNEMKNTLLDIKKLPEVERPVIDHEEHGPNVFEPGIYIKDIENETDAETEETRKVVD